MPSTIVDVPQFPTVPQLPGVPPLIPNPNAIFNIPSIVLSDAPGLGGVASRGRWGLYTTGGSPALVADAVGAVEYARDYAISDYPQTQGAFESYNKVQRPYQAKLTYLVGTNRPNFLNQAEQIAKALDLFSVVTPDISYAQANVVHLGYRRIAANGVSLIQVEIWVEEVRVVGTTTLSNGQSSNSAESNQDGVVQPSESLTKSATAADGEVTRSFVTPQGLSVGGTLQTQPSITSPTELNSSFSQEFGSRLITNPLGIQSTTLQPGLNISAPDVAITATGETRIVPISGGVTPPT